MNELRFVYGERLERGVGVRPESKCFCVERERKRNIEKEKERLPLLLLIFYNLKNKLNIKILTIITP